MYGVDYFKEPVAYNFGNELVKVPGLDGSGKMSKSEGESATIYLIDDASVLKKKIMRAKTDAGPQAPNSPKSPEIENLFSLLRLVGKEETVKEFEARYADCSIRYGDLKKQLAEDMEAFLAPIRERIKEVEADDIYLSRIAREGSEKARESARKTINEVREIIGFHSI